MTYAEGETICQTLGGVLPNIENAAENNIIASKITTVFEAPIVP